VFIVGQNLDEIDVVVMAFALSSSSRCFQEYTSRHKANRVACHPQNRKYITGFSAAPPEGSRAMITGNTDENLVKFGYLVSEISSRKDRQTDTPTDTLHIPPGGGGEIIYTVKL